MRISHKFQEYIDLNIDGDIFETSVGRQKTLWQGQPEKISVQIKIMFLTVAIALIGAVLALFTGDEQIFFGTCSLLFTFAFTICLIIAPRPLWRLAFPSKIVYVLTDKQGYMFYSFLFYRGFETYSLGEMKSCKRIDHKNETVSFSKKNSTTYKSREETSYGTTRTVTRTANKFHGFYNISASDASEVERYLS